MRSKKKSKTKQAKSKGTTVSKRTPSRKRAIQARPGTSAKRKSAQIKKSTKRRSRPGKATVNPLRDLEQEIRNKKLTGAEIASGRQSDFHGLSRAEEADSESVDELVEEGNVFEAGAVSGVEEADSADEREVVTHEVPEDDVPEEYLDKE